MTSKRPLLLAATAVALLAGGVALAASQGAPEPVRARDGRIVITMDDFRYEPQRIRAAKGRLRIEVRNVGRLPHALRLIRTRTGGEAGRILTRKPGEEGLLEVKVNRGSYRYFCPLSHHDELGMYGQLVVR
jgi:plastocyanin